jgi:hypothetical protein
VETLSKMLSTIENGGFFSGFFVGSRNIGELNISHLLIVDGTLIFYGAKPNHLCCLCALLLCFEAISGFKINIAQSELVLVGNVINVDGLTGIQGCGVFALPLKYFGLPLGEYFKANLFGVELLRIILG